MRTLAIDPGSRRVGLALSDAVGRLATPYDVLQVRSLGQSIDPILKIIQSEGVQRVVVGLPLNMDGTRGPGAQMAIAFGADLTAHGVKSVVFVDERLSTFAAEQNLLDRKRGGEKITRKKKKGRLDALAAASFLQDFLDGKLAALDAK